MHGLLSQEGSLYVCPLSTMMKIDPAGLDLPRAIQAMLLALCSATWGCWKPQQQVVDSHDSANIQL